VKFLLLVLVLIGISQFSWGQSSSLNLNLPNSSQTYASDRVRAGQTECSQAIGSSTNVEFGVVGFINRDNQYPYTPVQDFTMPEEQVKDIGVYARITIPIGAPKERINCNTLYQLELEKKRVEVFKLKQEIENLKALRFAAEEDEE
tara:strand:+ start:1248 stop:1685 length:438 start_codon:yes stop_codon:yes gene_type:complete